MGVLNRLFTKEKTKQAVPSRISPKLGTRGFAHARPPNFERVMATLGGYSGEDLDSEFDATERKAKSIGWRGDPLVSDRQGASATSHLGKLPSKQVLVDERDKEEWRSRRFHLLSMDAYSRHKTLINQYLQTIGQGIEHVKRPTERDRNDYDVLQKHHRFIWDDETHGDAPPQGSWEDRLAKSYYDKLFKEYALSDLSKYKENKIALRWRTEREVVEGKGQFVCGNKVCGNRDGLQSWEVNFAYLEQGEKKNALVKLRLCPKCSKKLNYHHKRKLWKRREKRKKKESGSGSHRKKPKKEDSSTDSSSTTDNEEKPFQRGEDVEDDQTKAPSSSEEVWRKSARQLVDKSKEEEFDDYFKDMLL